MKAKIKPLLRVYAPFNEDELEALDNWGFANRIRERSQVIRELALKGLDVLKHQEKRTASHVSAQPAV